MVQRWACWATLPMIQEATRAFFTVHREGDGSKIDPGALRSP